MSGVMRKCRVVEWVGDFVHTTTVPCVLSAPRGCRRAQVLYADPPLPPPPLEIGTEVPDHQRQRRPKANLLEPLDGQKMGFHPMCLYSKYSVFSGESNDG